MERETLPVSHIPEVGLDRELHNIAVYHWNSEDMAGGGRCLPLGSTPGFSVVGEEDLCRGRAIWSLSGLSS